MLIKPCILNFSCPGDNGDTFIVINGELHKVSKAHHIVKLLGAIDSALSSLFYAANFLDEKGYRKQARISRLIGFGIFNVSFYIATSNALFIERSNMYFSRAIKQLMTLNYAFRRGWVICKSMECSVLDRARVDIRWAERRLAQTEFSSLVKYFNLASNIIFETMLSTPHIIYISK